MKTWHFKLKFFLANDAIYFHRDYIGTFPYFTWEGESDSTIAEELPTK